MAATGNGVGLPQGVLVPASIERRDVDVQSRSENGTLLAEGDGDRPRVILRLPPEEAPKPVSRLRVEIAKHTVQLFDPATGLAVRPR